MSLAEMHAKVKAGIWQAIAQSGVDVSSLPKADLDKLVGTITGGVLKEIDDVLGEVSGQPVSQLVNQANADEEAERVLWEGRPYLSLSVHYQITTERVRITEGLLGKDKEDIELVRVQDIDHTQSLTERAFNIGDIHIRSHDPSNPEVVLNNVSNPNEVHEILRRAVINARNKYKLTYREEM
jgi:hypothetical protein